MDSEQYWQAIAERHALTARLLCKRYPLQAYMTCEDAVSAAAIQLFRHHERVQQTTIAAYLFQAARSQIIDIIRRQYRQRQLEGAYALAVGFRAPEPEHRIIAQQLLRHYLSHLLPKVQRRLLACLVDGSLAVGKDTGRTPGAVRAGVWKARRKLERVRQRDARREAG